MTKRLWFSVISLAVIFVVGVTYTFVALIQTDPRHPPYTVSIELPSSGGLLERSNVSLRGTVIGRVSRIALDDQGGVKVELAIKDDVKLPRNTDVLVGALSVAGEQYVDFRPRQPNGPYFADGDDVHPHGLTMPVPFSTLLTHLVSFADDIDPADISVIGHQLAVATDGSGDDLRRLFANARSLMGTLQATRADTLGILDNGSTVLGMTNDLHGDLDAITRSSRTLAKELRTSTPSLSTILDKGPGTVNQVNGLLKALRDPMDLALHGADVLMSVLSPRSPALAALFPALQFAASRASTVVNTGAIMIVADLALAKTCSYGTPLRSPTIGGSPSPFLYAYCKTFLPKVQQRGPYYAPRPNGDDTAHAPRGVSGTQRAGKRP